MSKHSLCCLNRKKTRRAMYRTKQELAMYQTTMFPIMWTWMLNSPWQYIKQFLWPGKAFSWFVNCNSRNLSQKDSTVWCSGISSCVLISFSMVLLSLSFLVYSCSSTFNSGSLVDITVGDHVMLHKVSVQGAVVVFTWINLGVDGWYYSHI